MRWGAGASSREAGGRVQRHSIVPSLCGPDPVAVQVHSQTRIGAFKMPARPAYQEKSSLTAPHTPPSFSPPLSLHRLLSIPFPCTPRHPLGRSRPPLTSRLDGCHTLLCSPLMSLSSKLGPYSEAPFMQQLLSARHCGESSTCIIPNPCNSPGRLLYYVSPF